MFSRFVATLEIYCSLICKISKHVFLSVEARLIPQKIKLKPMEAPLNLSWYEIWPIDSAFMAWESQAGVKL